MGFNDGLVTPEMSGYGCLDVLRPYLRNVDVESLIRKFHSARRFLNSVLDGTMGELANPAFALDAVHVCHYHMTIVADLSKILRSHFFAS